MAGAIEESAKLAGGFLDALKREPLSLSLVVMNLALLGAGYLLLTTVAAQREREVNLMYADKREVRELLAKCVVPNRGAAMEEDSSPTVTGQSVPLPKPRPEEGPL